MPKSDVEIVVVDTESQLYWNTIVQLRLMGYVEILEIDQNGPGQINTWYTEYEKVV